VLVPSGADRDRYDDNVNEGAGSRSRMAPTCDERETFAKAEEQLFYRDRTVFVPCFTPLPGSARLVDRILKLLSPIRLESHKAIAKSRPRQASSGA
jgi:hypothetical protein